MSLIDRIVRPSAEPAIGSAPVQADRCRACHQPGTAMGTIVLPGYGPDMVCVDFRACRQRAQLAGVYGVVA